MTLPTCGPRLLAGFVALCLASSLHAQATPQERSVRVSVLDDAGRPVEGAYVALVPEDRPWSEPAREEILTRGSEVRWDLSDIPRGLALRLAVGAPGHSTEQSGPIFLSPSGVTEHEARLQRLEPLPGRVTNEAGEPVAAARVGQIRAFGEGFGLQLSELARRYLLGTWSVVTNEEGRFALPLDPRGGHNVVIQASGFALVLLPNVTPDGPKQAPTDFLDVTLEPGARLELELTASDGIDPDGRGWVELASEATAGGPTAVDFRVLWRRRLPVEEGRLVWDALAPGRYEVRAQGETVGAHGVVPTPLAEVRLAASQREVLQIALPAGSASTETVSAPPVDVLLAEVPIEALEGVTVEIWSADGSRVPVEGSVESVSGGTVLRVPGGCRAGAHVLVKTEDRIAAVGPVEPVAGACATTRRSTLRPLGDVGATLLAPRPSDGERLPARGLLRLADCPTGARPGSGVETLERLEVPVRLTPPGEGEPQRPERALLNAPLPADCGWASLSVGPFAPVTVPAPERAEPGVRVDLGRVELHHGGAILARVVRGDGVALVDARLDAWPHEEEGDRPTQRPGADPSARSIASGTTDEQGWVRLYGLPPGAVELLVTPEDREVPHRTPHVVVGAREEVVLDPLEVPEPGSLTLELVGLLDLLDDDLVPHMVTIQWRGPGPSPPVQQLSHPLGELPGEIVFDGIPPGRWSVAALAWMHGVGSEARRVASTEVVLARGEAKRQRLVFDYPVFQGRITWRGEPVYGSASFAPVPWDDRHGMTVLLDEDGRFKVPLERAGSYSLQISARELDVTGALIPFAEFEDPTVDQEFRLPEGRIAGRVITDTGDAVVEAWVNLLSFRDLPGSGGGVASLRRRIRTDPSGRFVLEAVNPGVWTLEVATEGGSKARDIVRLDAEEWRTDVELVLSDKSTEAQILDRAGGAISGARGALVLEPVGVGTVASAFVFETDAEGRFEVAASTPFKATVQLETPSGVWAAGRISSENPVFRVLTETGGRFRVRLPANRSPAWRAEGLWLIDRQTGGYLDLLRAGSAWVDSEGGFVGYEIAALAPGSWQLVKTPDFASLDALWRGLGYRLAPLADFQLVEGGTVLVELANLQTDNDRKAEK